MAISDVSVLTPNEQIALDAVEFQARLFEAGANQSAVTETDSLFEDLIVCLSSLESAWFGGEFDRLVVQIDKLIVISDEIGLDQCGDVARALSCVVKGSDTVALAALVARVVRLGEASLASVLEHAYLRS